MGEEKEKMKTWKKVVIALIIILLILTAAAYGYGVHYFTDHFLPGSQVNGFNCSYMTQEETEKLLAEETSVYILAIQTRGNGRESISADEIDLKYTSDGRLESIADGFKKLLRIIRISLISGLYD